MQHRNPRQAAEDRAQEWAARDDRLIMRDMMDRLRKALSEALGDCERWSVDLKHIDADQLMTDLRAEFDPYEERSAIQDAFSDVFGAAWKKRSAALGETLWNKDEMPSGALKDGE